MRRLMFCAVAANKNCSLTFQSRRAAESADSPLGCWLLFPRFQRLAQIAAGVRFAVRRMVSACPGMSYWRGFPRAQFLFTRGKRGKW